MTTKDKIRNDGIEVVQLYSFKIFELRNAFAVAVGENVILTQADGFGCIAGVIATGGREHNKTNNSDQIKYLIIYTK